MSFFSTIAHVLIAAIPVAAVLAGALTAAGGVA